MMADTTIQSLKDALEVAQVDARQLRLALKNLVDSLSANDEEGLIEHAQQMQDARAALQGSQGEPMPTDARGAAYQWAYEHLQSRLEGLGRHGWAHDCDGEIAARIAAGKVVAT